MASSLIDNDALKYGDRQRSKAELQHWWSYDLRFEKKSLSNIYFWIVFLFLMCALLCLYFLFFFHCLLCCLLREHFLICCSRVLISLCCILTLDANFILTVTILFSLPILTFVQWLCSHKGWLLLKWSAVGLGFNRAETNCRIANVLGILLMISYWFAFISATSWWSVQFQYISMILQGYY